MLAFLRAFSVDDFSVTSDLMTSEMSPLLEHLCLLWSFSDHLRLSSSYSSDQMKGVGHASPCPQTGLQVLLLLRSCMEDAPGSQCGAASRTSPAVATSESASRGSIPRDSQFSKAERHVPQLERLSKPTQGNDSATCAWSS